MKNVIYIILVFATLKVSAQKCICKYYHFDYSEMDAQDVFTFKNGQRLKICPVEHYNFDNDNKNYYRNFALESCNDHSPILIGNDYTYTSIEMVADTLIAAETMELAVGKNRKMERVTLGISKILSENGKFTVRNIDFAFRKFSDSEIRKTILEYEKAAKLPILKVRQLVSCLFIAALSDEKAKLYFLDLKPKYKDEILDYYQDLTILFYKMEREK